MFSAPSLRDKGEQALTSGSYLSFSAETCTPESCRGGLLSRVGGLSPDSRPSVPEPSERLDDSCKASVQDLRVQRPSDRQGAHFRRRKYVTQGTGLRDFKERLFLPLPDVSVGDVQVRGGQSTSVSEIDSNEVLIEGSLQQRVLLWFWRSRWCVLDRQEFRIYRDEEASLIMPESPLERYSAHLIGVAPDAHTPSVLLVRSAGSARGELILHLRTGMGLRWEEQAASALWCWAFSSVTCSKRNH